MSGYATAGRGKGALALDYLAEMVILRAAELREGKKKRPLKKKAMVDLLKKLKAMGLSYHKGAIPMVHQTLQSHQHCLPMI